MFRFVAREGLEFCGGGTVTFFPIEADFRNGADKDHSVKRYGRRESPGQLTASVVASDCRFWSLIPQFSRNASYNRTSGVEMGLSVVDRMTGTRG